MITHLPPISLIDKVTIVLSPKTAFPISDKPVWTLIPRVSLLPNDNVSAVFITGLEKADIKMNVPDLTADINADKEDDSLLMDKSVIALVKDIADPIYNFMMDDNVTVADSTVRYYIYDISAIVISHIIRGITNNQLDLHLLTQTDNNSYFLINGLELGIRPDPSFGLRIRVQNDNITATNYYGLELHLYPTDNIALKIIHGDNSTDQRTGMELNLVF